jgi:dTDP-4-amino-4,6-dideoxygalactose transaminase
MKSYSRRKFIKQNSLTSLGAILGMNISPSMFSENIRAADIPVVLGGQKIRTKGWPKWPLWIPEADEPQVIEVLRSGVWSRSKLVIEFEAKWAEINGAKRCLTTVNGTNALITALKCLDVGGGDEVIVTPYTWIATTQSILQTGAIPVFVDVDPDTFQIDPEKIEAKITPRTRAILPVHILGLPANMERIMEIAKKHNLVVVEDCCQAWLSEINHKKVGTFGNAGCFSFQNSKNMTIGEGGAIISNDEAYMDRCYSFHNFGQPYGTIKGVSGTRNNFLLLGTKVRLSEYQAAMALAQLKRLEAQTTIRNENADYLRKRLKEIPGIIPHKLYPNATRAAYHLFPFRYIKEDFQGLPREEFIKAVSAEGVPCSSGYDSTLNSSPYLKDAFESKNFKLMYPKKMLDFNVYLEQNRCPVNDNMCREAVWLGQNMLLGTRSDLDEIIMAIDKVRKNAGKIKSQIKG